MNTQQLSGAMIFYAEIRQDVKKKSPRKLKKLSVMLRLGLAIKSGNEKKAMKAITEYSYLMNADKFTQNAL